MSRKRRPSHHEDGSLPIASSSHSFFYDNYCKLSVGERQAIMKPTPEKEECPSDDEIFVMDDCAAAMLLMNLSCSPKSPNLVTNHFVAKAGKAHDQGKLSTDFVNN
jgi:hypothetical protein